MSGVTSFRARHGTAAYATGAVTWDNSTPLDNESFAANIAELKDVTVTYPEQSYEKIDFMGNSAQTVGANQQTIGTATGVVASNFQNQAIQSTSVGMWQVEGTLVMKGDEDFVDLLGLGNSQSITGGYTRYSVGDLTSAGASQRNTLGSFRLYLNNGSEESTLLLSNVHVSLGDIKPTGADGHYERTFTLVCLAKDGAVEFKD